MKTMLNNSAVRYLRRNLSDVEMNDIQSQINYVMDIAARIGTEVCIADIGRAVPTVIARFFYRLMKGHQ